MENFVLGFFNLRYKLQQFYEFSTSKFLANFRDFDIFCIHLNFKSSALSKTNQKL
jgi:hypothetical protein